MQLSSFLADLHQVFRDQMNRGGDLVIDEDLVRAFADGLGDAVMLADMQERVLETLAQREASSRRIEELLQASDEIVQRIRADADRAEAGLGAMGELLGPNATVLPFPEGARRRSVPVVLDRPSGGAAS